MHLDSSQLLPNVFWYQVFVGYRSSLSVISFFKFILTNIPLSFLQNLSLSFKICKSFEGMSYLTESRIQPPRVLLSSQQGLLNSISTIYLKSSFWKRVIKLTFSYQKYANITSYCYFQGIKRFWYRFNIKLSCCEAANIFLVLCP